MKSRLTILSVAMLLLCASVVSAQMGSSETSSDRSSGESRIGLAFRWTAGIVMGRAADYFDKFNERAFYGAAGALEYRKSQRWIFGANVEVTWKGMSAYHVDAIRMTSLSGSGLFRMSRNPRKSAYARAELGRISGNWDSHDLGTYWFGRLGIGEYTRTGGITSTRFEIYYKKAFTDDRVIDLMGRYRIDGDGEGVGLEFALVVDL